MKNFIIYPVLLFKRPKIILPKKDLRGRIPQQVCDLKIRFDNLQTTHKTTIIGTSNIIKFITETATRGVL